MDGLDGWNFWWTVGASAVAAIDFVSIVFLFAWKYKRIDLIDSFWGPTFIVIAATALLLGSPRTFASWLVAAMVVIWGTRLWLHIFRRFLSSKTQDARYTTLAGKWPQRHVWAQVYARVYLVQALLAVVISLPVIAITHGSTAGRGAYVAIGLVVWAAGFVFEAIADRQLAGFIRGKDNKGKLMTRGLWRYSRHPNYFGEMTQWWGIWIMSLGTRYAAVAVIGPLAITLLIRFVSGVPPAEERMSSKPGWEDYRRRTSMLLPLPPASGK